jgi:hypothetical protein
MARRNAWHGLSAGSKVVMPAHLTINRLHTASLDANVRTCRRAGGCLLWPFALPGSAKDLVGHATGVMGAILHLV